MNTFKKLFSGLWLIITALLFSSLIVGLLALGDYILSVDYDSAIFMIWFGGVGLIIAYFLARYLDVPGR